MIEGETHLWAKDAISVTDIREPGNLPADASIVSKIYATAPNER
jgi:hypothetical protein